MMLMSFEGTSCRWEVPDIGLTFAGAEGTPICQMGAEGTSLNSQAPRTTSSVAQRAALDDTEGVVAAKP